jgi:hypothetical protein
LANYSYEHCVAQSVKVQWQIDEVLPPGHRLDFSRPHLPESLVKVHGLDFLEPAAKLALNHIRALPGNSWVNFGPPAEHRA